MTHRLATALAAIALLAIHVAWAQDAGSNDAGSHDTMDHDAVDHDTVDHDAVDHDAHDHASHDHDAMSMDGIANVIAVSGLDLKVEPMLDLDGRFAVALSTFHEELPTTAPVHGVLRTPSGQRVLFAAIGTLFVTETVAFEPGTYVLEGEVGHAPFSIAMSAQIAQTDLDSELVMFLVPAPTGETPTASHVVVYAFADGENIHQRFAVTQGMPAMEHTDGNEEFLMMHSHFVHVPLADVPGEEAFDPMSNEVTLGFGMAGDWIVDVVIGTGFSAERASFDVRVGGE